MAPQIYRLPEVMLKTGLSRSSIYRQMTLTPPTFPQPVKLGEKSVGWISTEIDAWITSRMAVRDQAADGAPRRAA